MKETKNYGSTKLVVIALLLILAYTNRHEIIGAFTTTTPEFTLEVPVIEEAVETSALPTVPPGSELSVAGASMASEEDLSQTSGQANHTEQSALVDGNAVAGDVTIFQGTVNIEGQTQTTIDEAMALNAPVATPVPPTPTPLPSPTPAPTPTPRLITVDGTIVVMEKSLFGNNPEGLSGVTVDIYPRSGGPRYVAYTNDEGQFSAMVPEDPLGYDVAFCGQHEGETWSAYIQQMSPKNGGTFEAAPGNNACRYDE